MKHLILLLIFTLSLLAEEPYCYTKDISSFSEIAEQQLVTYRLSNETKTPTPWYLSYGSHHNEPVPVLEAGQTKEFKTNCHTDCNRDVTCSSYRSPDGSIIYFTQTVKCDLKERICNCGTEETKQIDETKFEILGEVGEIEYCSTTPDDQKEHNSKLFQQCTDLGGFMMIKKIDLCCKTLQCFKPSCGDSLPIPPDECKTMIDDGIPNESGNCIRDITSNDYNSSEGGALSYQRGYNVCEVCYYETDIPNCVPDSNSTDNNDSNSTPPTDSNDTTPVDNNQTDSNGGDTGGISDNNKTDCYAWCDSEYGEGTDSLDLCRTQCYDDNNSPEGYTPPDQNETNSSEDNNTDLNDNNSDDGNTTNNSDDGNNTNETGEGNTTTWGSDKDFKDLFGGMNTTIGNELNGTFNTYFNKFASGFTVNIPKVLSDGCACKDATFSASIKDELYESELGLCEYISLFLDEYVPLLKFVIYILIARQAVRRFV